MLWKKVASALEELRQPKLHLINEKVLFVLGYTLIHKATLRYCILPIIPKYIVMKVNMAPQNFYEQKYMYANKTPFLAEDCSLHKSNLVYSTLKHTNIYKKGI